jgi:hypothetical protein
VVASGACTSQKPLEEVLSTNNEFGLKNYSGPIIMTSLIILPIFVIFDYGGGLW